jgi:hypothetical protein
LAPGENGPTIVRHVSPFGTKTVDWKLVLSTAFASALLLVAILATPLFVKWGLPRDWEFLWEVMVGGNALVGAGLVVFAVKRLRAGITAADLVPFFLGTGLLIVAWAAVRDGHSYVGTNALLPYLVLGVGFVVFRALPDRTPVAWIITGSALLVAASVIVDAYGPVFSERNRAPGGLLQNRNFAGEHIAIALPIAFAVLTRSRVRPVLLAFGTALLWTRCRTAWIAGGIALTTLLALSPGRRSNSTLRTSVHLGLGLLLGAALSANLRWAEKRPYAASLSRLADLDAGSGAMRAAQYRETAAMLTDQEKWWTGLGPGRWQQTMVLKDRHLASNTAPHSDCLRLLADGGIPLLLVGLLTLLGIGMRLLPERELAPAGSLLSLAIVGMADAALFRPDTSLVLAVLLGICGRSGNRLFSPQNLRQPATNGGS